MEFILVLVTTASEEEAEKIAQEIVKTHLAACVNIVPRIKSIYFWKGEVCKDAESLLIIKTRGEKFDTLKEKIIQLHSYEVPEVIAIPIVKGSKAYLDWLAQVT
ncbi:MAG: divalent-cation tolerance protein CutA [Candidatus Desulfofervidaceae bacterium]|nr:divalent-cation tolerance protein CutA [Candidatus Desulfofervidaceae bacterium]MDL1969997.1 divalent-cation tolerance protein CutA [Candidatus Desulfofervidaceae bacterium]